MRRFLFALASILMRPSILWGAVCGVILQFILLYVPEPFNAILLGIIIGMPFGGFICGFYWIKHGYLRGRW